MKKIFFVLSAVLLTQIMLAEFAYRPTRRDIIAQQHILDLCRTTQKDSEACKQIIDVLTRQAIWARMSALQKIWNYNKMPMPADLSRAVLHSQAKALGKEMGWSNERIENEWDILCALYDKKNNG